MRYQANSIEEYISQLPEDRIPVINKLREVINQNIPEDFHETLSYGMIGWVVPHSIYPDGYHCNPKLPLPFLNIASQKNFVAVYHMGVYSDQTILDWFVGEYPKYSKRKLDMGKSCIRLKKMEDIPYDLIGKLCSKITVNQWVNTYENTIKNRKK